MALQFRDGGKERQPRPRLRLLLGMGLMGNSKYILMMLILMRFLLCSAIYLGRYV